MLEVCDPENLKTTALAEQQMAEANDEFEEDLVLMTQKSSKTQNTEDDFISSEEDNLTDDFEESEDDSSIDESPKSKKRKRENEEDDAGDNFLNSDEDIDDFEESEEDSITDESPKSKKNDNKGNDKKESKKLNSDDEFSADDSDENKDLEDESSEETNEDGTWEDIYGRLRAKDGSVVTSGQKYVPPAARLKSEDSSRSQKVERLTKQLKGLMNRLAESNMHSIATQIEELYMSNSRNDMNSVITNLVIEALVSNILAPERLLMEHVLLITVLHANVGTEVGAHFLQTIVKLFDEYLKNPDESKKLDNVIIILAQLYNFKLFDCKLIYEILDKLADIFEEKHVECILHILRNVGFSLRKDNPIALKNLILSLQKRASNVSDELKDK